MPSGADRCSASWPRPRAVSRRPGRWMQIDGLGWPGARANCDVWLRHRYRFVGYCSPCVSVPQSMHRCPTMRWCPKTRSVPQDACWCPRKHCCPKKHWCPTTRCCPRSPMFRARPGPAPPAPDGRGEPVRRAPPGLGVVRQQEQPSPAASYKSLAETRPNP